MRPYKQGQFARVCSIFAVINGIRLLGIDLKPSQAQDLYDYIVDKLGRCVYHDMVLYGADRRRLERIMSIANEYITTHYNKHIHYSRPLCNTKLDASQLIDFINNERLNGKTAIIRIIGGSIDHYTVFLCVQQNQIKLFDSNGMASLKLADILTGKFKIHRRHVYILEAASATNHSLFFNS